MWGCSRCSTTGKQAPAASLVSPHSFTPPPRLPNTYCLPSLGHVRHHSCYSREPTERLESHLRYTLLNWGSALDRPVRPGGPQMGQLLCSNWPDPSWEAGTWHDLAPPVADNYMTR